MKNEIQYIQYRVGSGFTNRTVGGSGDNPVTSITHIGRGVHQIITEDGNITTVFEVIKTETKL